MYKNENKKFVKNELKTFKVFLKGKTFKMSYSLDSLKEILNSDVFSKIQIPVYMHNSTLFGENKKGLSTVGNIISYNDETGEMLISIFGKFVSKINDISDAIVFPRVTAVYDKNEVVDKEAEVKKIKILGFDIASETFYSEI